MNAVTDKELDAFYGVAIDDTSVANPAIRAIRAIRAIGASDMTPMVAAVITAALASQISKSNHSHFESTHSAIEYLDDASTVLMGAAA